MALIEFVGGPYDGLRRQISAPPSFFWLTKEKVYRRSGVGRMLYRSVATKQEDSKIHAYLFSAFTYGQCEKCASFGKIPGERKGNRCSLCGGTVKVGG